MYSTKKCTVVKDVFYFVLLLLNAELTPPQQVTSPLAGKIICVDAGHGGTAKTDSYRAGPSGEQEEWINLRVALLLRDMLEERGAQVVMTRTEDEPERAGVQCRGG